VTSNPTTILHASPVATDDAFQALMHLLSDRDTGIVVPAQPILAVTAQDRAAITAMILDGRAAMLAAPPKDGDDEEEEDDEEDDEDEDDDEEGDEDEEEGDEDEDEDGDEDDDEDEEDDDEDEEEEEGDKPVTPPARPAPVRTVSK
jgi:hypothetical protein